LFIFFLDNFTHTKERERERPDAVEDRSCVRLSFFRFCSPFFFGVLVVLDTIVQAFAIGEHLGGGSTNKTRWMGTRHFFAVCFLFLSLLSTPNHIIQGAEAQTKTGRTQGGRGSRHTNKVKHTHSPERERERNTHRALSLSLSSSQPPSPGIHPPPSCETNYEDNTKTKKPR